MPTFKHANVLGVKVSAINIPLALEIIDTWIKNRQHHYVTITGVHGVMESQRDEKIRDITQKATKAIEDIVRLYPAQYFWFHRRWKTSPKKLTGKNRDKREKRRLFRTAGELDPKDEKRPG